MVKSGGIHWLLSKRHLELLWKGPETDLRSWMTGILAAKCPKISNWRLQLWGSEQNLTNVEEMLTLTIKRHTCLSEFRFIFLSKDKGCRLTQFITSHSEEKEISTLRITCRPSRLRVLYSWSFLGSRHSKIQYQSSLGTCWACLFFILDADARPEPFHGSGGKILFLVNRALKLNSLSGEKSLPPTGKQEVWTGVYTPWNKS